MGNLEIVLLEASQETLDVLATTCAALGVITVQRVDRVLYTRPPSGLDAIFLLVTAAEKWGSEPILEAQIFTTFPDDQRNGMPPWIVAGGVLNRNNPRDPVVDTKLVIGTALDVVRKFNLRNAGKPIHRLGFWAVNLLEGGVTPEQLSTIFAEVL